MFDAPIHHEVILPTPSEEQLRFAFVKQQALEYMSQLHGWCSPQKGAFLVDLVMKTKPTVIVEIGVWGGKSLIPMARALKENNRGVIFGIDPWESKESTMWVMEEVNRHFWEYADHALVYNHLSEKIAQFSLQSQIKLMRTSSELAPPIPGIDILHIDGNHSDYTSYLDVTKWVPLMNSGGWIIFDDMTWFENGAYTNKRATEWLDANCHKLAEFSDICTWGVWVKP